MAKHDGEAEANDPAEGGRQEALTEQPGDEACPEQEADEETPDRQQDQEEPKSVKGKGQADDQRQQPD